MIQDGRHVIATADHLIVFAFAVLLPAYAWYNYPKFKRALKSGEPGVRSRQYRRTILRQWGLTILALTIWVRSGRSFDALGLGVPAGAAFFIGLVLAAGLAQFWRIQIRAALEHDKTRARLVDQLRAVAPILPTSPTELRLFTALSLTAGMCEEILFRGYLIWYLERYVGVAGAVILSSILFGIGHIYQGRRQAFKIIFLGLLLALFYVGSGSLWIPIALHAALDAAQGRLAHRLRDQELLRVGA